MPYRARRHEEGEEGEDCVTEPTPEEGLMKSLFGGSFSIPTREEILAKLRACGDPRAAAIIQDIERESAATPPKPEVPVHPSGFRLLKGGKE